MEMKQGLQSFWWFFGRIIKARASLQMAQGAGAILKKESFLLAYLSGIFQLLLEATEYFEISQ
jgi:hypothetical protein